jgi:hypothetical protein
MPDFWGTTYQNGKNTKGPQNVSNGIIYNIMHGSKIDQMAIKYTNIFHCKTLQNLTKMGFWFLKYNIWQLW